MIFIFGGAYQGKLDFALDSFGAEKTVFRCAADGAPEPDLKADIIYGYHELVLALLRAGIEPCEYTRSLLAALEDKMVICDDISSGVVPIDPEMRAWREAAGRCSAILAARSKGVYRVFCGIGTHIK